MPMQNVTHPARRTALVQEAWGCTMGQFPSHLSAERACCESSAATATCAQAGKTPGAVHALQGRCQPLGRPRAGGQCPKDETTPPNHGARGSAESSRTQIRACDYVGALCLVPKVPCELESAPATRAPHAAAAWPGQRPHTHGVPRCLQRSPALRRARHLRGQGAGRGQGLEPAPKTSPEVLHVPR